MKRVINNFFRRVFCYLTKSEGSRFWISNYRCEVKKDLCDPANFYNPTSLQQAVDRYISIARKTFRELRQVERGLPETLKVETRISEFMYLSMILRSNYIDWVQDDQSCDGGIEGIRFEDAGGDITFIVSDDRETERIKGGVWLVPYKITYSAEKIEKITSNEVIRDMFN